MKERHEKYKEIILLEHLLQENAIPFQIDKLFDGYQIVVPGKYERRSISAIEHFGSYGSAFDTIEIQEPSGTIRGFLKAEAAMEIIQHEYKKRWNGESE